MFRSDKAVVSKSDQKQDTPNVSMPKKRKFHRETETTAHSTAPMTDAARTRDFLSSLEKKQRTIFASHGSDSPAEGRSHHGEGSSRTFEHKGENNISKDDEKHLDIIKTISPLLLQHYARRHPDLQPVVAYRRQLKDKQPQPNEETVQKALESWKSLPVDVSSKIIQQRERNRVRTIPQPASLIEPSRAGLAEPGTLERQERASSSKQVENLTSSQQDIGSLKQKRSKRQRISSSSLHEREDRGHVWDELSKKLHSADQRTLSSDQDSEKTSRQESESKLTKEEIEHLAIYIHEIPDFNTKKFKHSSKEIQQIVNKLQQHPLDDEQWNYAKKLLKLGSHDKRYLFFYENTQSRRGKKRIENNYKYKKDLAIKKGYKSVYEHNSDLAIKKGYKSMYAYKKYLAIKKGYKSMYAYKKYLAIKKGYKSVHAYKKDLAMKKRV